MWTRVKQFFHYVMPAVLRPLHVLWNQIIGFVFIVLALWAVPSTIRAVREFDGDTESLVRIALAASFVTMMLWFGITSFLRARKISRS